MRQTILVEFYTAWLPILRYLRIVNSPTEDIERRWQAELLAIFTFFLLLSQVIALPLYFWGIFRSNSLVSYILATSVFVVVYILNRRGYYSIAAYILIWGAFTAVHLSLLTGSIALIFYSGLLFLISGIFLSLRATYFLMITTIIVQGILVTQTVGNFTLSFLNAFTFTVFSSPLILIFIWHRLELGQARQKELERAIDSLQKSELLWRSVVSNSPDLIIEVDTNNIITFMNRINPGFPLSAVIGKPITDFILPEYHDAMLASFENTHYHHAVSEFEGKNVTLAGEEIWFSARVSPITSNNELEGFIINSRDISHHKASEEALRYFQGRQVEFQKYLTQLHDIRAQLATCDNLQEVYKQAVEFGIDWLKFDRMALFVIDHEKETVQGTYGIDQQGKLRQENDYIGLLAENAWDQVILAEQSVVFWHDVELVDYGRPVGQGWKAMTGLWDGKKAIGFMAIDNLITHYPPRAYEEELIAIYASILAQTILHRQSEQQRIRLAVQEEQVQLLEDLISDLSHDIRTPLTSIHNYLYLLKKQTDPAKMAKNLLALESQVNHLTRLVEDILAMARLDKGGTFNLEVVLIHDLIETIVHNYHAIAKKRNIQLEIRRENQVTTIPANSTELGRALSNLVENAVNYTPDGGTIVISTVQEGSRLAIAIKDSGIGISEEELPQIFDRFYRADKARNTIKGGSGLGLAIVKRVIELHQGTLHVESKLGEGSTFKIGLPLDDKNGKNKLV